MKTFDPFEQPTFGNPWSLRVFGVTLAAAEAGAFTLKEFQQALIERIGSLEAAGGCVDSDETYYTQWAEALTTLLERKRVIGPDRLVPAEQAVRDALEAMWHDHDHDHDDDHEVAPQPVFVEAAR